jgi:transcriptional regulator with XRE-family HTH domain
MSTDTKTKTVQMSGEVFKLWREQMGYTQRVAAEALGCSQASIVAWELERSRIPTYIGLAMGALALGMEPYGATPVA